MKRKAPFEKCRIRNRWWWRRAHLRSRIGVVITVGYLALMILTVLLRSEDFRKLALNELGDFLGGTFAPMALLWLVIGYFQQGDELRQNSRALLLQAEELRQTAEHAGGLLDVARREHDLAIEKLNAEQEKLKMEQQVRDVEGERQKIAQERRRKGNLQPRISFGLAFIDDDGKARVKLENRRNDCKNFSLEIPDNSVLKLVEPVEAESLKYHAALFFQVEALTRLGTTPVIARWTDAEGDAFKGEFTASVADKHINIDD